VNRHEELEKAAAAREAREAVGGQRRTGSRSDEVEAALMHYLATESFRERPASSPSPGEGERPDADEA
jgi:1,6-anhydro-N-acetylmuramate kinase